MTSTTYWLSTGLLGLLLNTRGLLILTTTYLEYPWAADSPRTSHTPHNSATSH